MSTMLETYREVARATPVASRRVRSWPSDAYADDPVGFAIEQLGRCPTANQCEVLESVRDHKRTTVRAGRRTGKSVSIAILAAWYFATFPEATVFLGGPCERQIDEIVYHELTGLLADQRCLRCRILHPTRTGHCPHVTPLDARIHASVRHGIRSADERRRIFGAAPRDAQAARGIAAPGKGLIALVDEMSGVPGEVFQVLQANVRASGGKLAVFGNPAKLNDPFWETHQETHGDWNRIRMSALDSPNVVLRRTVVDGLADYEWAEECLEAWGEDDLRYLVDVLGEFPHRTQLELISDEQLSEAFARFERIADPDEQSKGELWAGIDPAAGGGGDDSVIYFRRGHVVLECQAFQGGTDAIIARLKDLITKYRRDRAERVDVNFDDSSRIGSDLREALRLEAIKDPHVHWHGLNSRGAIERNSPLYGHGFARPRDAYWGNAAQRLKSSIAVAFDGDLREEWLTAEWLPDMENGLKRLIEKRVHRKKLGRSPDRADALAYCLFEGRIEPASNLTAELRAKRAAEMNAEDVPIGPSDAWDAANADATGNPYGWEDAFYRGED